MREHKEKKKKEEERRKKSKKERKISERETCMIGEVKDEVKELRKNGTRFKGVHHICLRGALLRSNICSI